MITDIDKSSFDRAKPSPNTHDTLDHASVMAKGTNSINYTTPSSNLSLSEAAKNGQFTIVQPGNFTTSTTINTTNPGTGNYASDLFTIYQQPHNLPFLPGVTAYELSSSGQYAAMPYTRYLTGTSAQALWYTFYMVVDATYVYILLNTMTFGNVSWALQPGFFFKWYLTYQTSN